MRTVSGYVRTGLVGSRVKFSFDVPNDTTDEEIEEMATEAMYDNIDWNYEVSDAGE